MATSDSEDFESADEGDDIDTGTPFLTPSREHGGELKGLQRDISAVTVTSDTTKEPKDTENKVLDCEVDKDVAEIKPDVSDTTGKEPDASARLEEVSDLKKLPEIQLEGNTQDVDNLKENRSNQRRRQKPKESKIGVRKLGAMKLGTKISSNEDKDIPIKVQSSGKKTSKMETELQESKSSSVIEKQVDEENVKVESVNAEKFKEAFSSIADGIPSQKSNDKSTWGWSGWGSSILSTASVSVTTLTSHVSQGISTVLETVETGIGAPDPEELARQDKLLEKELAEKVVDIDAKDAKPVEKNEIANPEKGQGLFGMVNLMSGVTQITKIVESTGTKVLSGGLDTLEVIGKKTMEVLQEGDPGFKKKRAFFHGDKPILSQILREAKEKADADEKEFEEKQAARKVHFESLFDDYQGLVHLEALEMLSKQCDMKIQSLLLNKKGVQLQDVQMRLNDIKEMCDIPEDADVDSNERFDEVLPQSVKWLGVQISVDKLLTSWENISLWIEECQRQQERCTDVNARQIHEKAISSLAEVTALAVELFHKGAELLMVKEDRDVEIEAENLVTLTTALSNQIGVISSKFSECLNTAADDSSDPESANARITNIFFEASNSSTYVQDAFLLLIPVLQIGAVQNV